MSHLLMRDTIALDGVRRTKDGYLAADARVARVGIQKYKGYELGRPDLGSVMVYRPPEEVFSKDALKSMTHRPVTLTHPPEVVDAKNWKKYAKGHTGDEVLRDGDHVRIPMVLMDAEAIDAVEGGTRELSWGYSTDLKWTPGVTPDGEKYDAKQTEIRANHLAIVPVARGGRTLKLGDSANSHQTKGRKIMNTILIDGAPVEVADDLSAAVITNKLKALTADAAKAKDDLEGSEEKCKKMGDAAAQTKAALDAATGEIAVLKKQVADAAITPEKLDAMVIERTAVVDAAMPILGKDYAFSGKKISDIRRAAVALALGDAETKDMDDAVVAGAFRALTIADAKGGTRKLAADVSRLPRGGQNATDLRDAAWADNLTRISNAWKGPQAA